MKLAPQDVQMLFLGTAGIGLDFGQIAPQLRSFDVYYSLPGVIGLSAVEPSQLLPGLVGLQIVGDDP